MADELNKVEKLGPGFNRLFGASAISNLADGLLAVAAPLLAITSQKPCSHLHTQRTCHAAMASLCDSHRAYC